MDVLVKQPRKNSKTRIYGDRRFAKRDIFSARTVLIPDRNICIVTIGWEVDRHLQDDYVVVFERQPPRHKMSITGRRAKVMDGRDFRLNPFFADAFEINEVNMRVPQSLPARAEMECLMMSPKLVVSAEAHGPAVGMNQAVVLVAFAMTKRFFFMEKHSMFSMLFSVDSWDGKIPAPAILRRPKELWTGKQLLSLILPLVGTWSRTANECQTLSSPGMMRSRL